MGQQIADRHNPSRQMKVNADGSIDANAVNSLVNFTYDYVSVAYPTDTTEVYTFKTGGSGGTTEGVITIVYTDSNKTDLSSASRA